MNVPKKSTSNTLVYIFKCDNGLLFKLTLNININSITLSNTALPRPVFLVYKSTEVFLIQFVIKLFFSFLPLSLPSRLP